MARRSDHSRDEIREMALRAAETILDREGAAGLSTRKIATEIGYTVGSLYLVFQNLDDLVVQVNARTLNHLGARLDEAATRADHPAGCVVELGRAYLHFASRHPGRWSLIFDRRVTSGTALPDWYLHLVRGLFERVEQLLGILTPRRESAEIALAARALWSGVHGVCILALDDKLDLAGVADGGKLTDALIENFLAGWTRAAEHSSPPALPPA